MFQPIMLMFGFIKPYFIFCYNLKNGLNFFSLLIIFFTVYVLYINLIDDTIQVNLTGILAIIALSTYFIYFMENILYFFFNVFCYSLFSKITDYLTIFVSFFISRILLMFFIFMVIFAIQINCFVII